MYEIRKTDIFASWLDSLTDTSGRARILARIKRLEGGHRGDVRNVGKDVSEMRIHCGPGYRVYFTHIGTMVILLLAGGDKSTQSKDIRQAMKMVENI
jgi:putative addiction module killer protein